MKHGCTEYCRKGVPTTLLRVGIEVFPVYGNEESGFSMDADDLINGTNKEYLYSTSDELFFALVNLNVSNEGLA